MRKWNRKNIKKLNKMLPNLCKAWVIVLKKKMQLGYLKALDSRSQSRFKRFDQTSNWQLGLFGGSHDENKI